MSELDDQLALWTLVAHVSGIYNISCIWEQSLVCDRWVSLWT